MANETPKSNNNNNKKSFNFYWIYAIIAVGIIATQVLSTSSVSKEITPNDFFDIAQKGFVEKIDIINNQDVDVFINDKDLSALRDYNPKYSKVTKGKSSFGESPQLTFASPDQKFFLDQVKEINDSLKVEGKQEINYKLVNQVNWMSILLNISLPLILIFGLYFLFMRRMGGGGGGGQIFNIGKSKAQLFEKGKGTNTTFKDVAGLEGAKEEIQEIVDFLKTPTKYTELGAKIPKGALLVGPPGTGKTLLAKAVAGEAQVPFFSLSGSDFVEMFVGVGASRVRDLFKQAKEKAPAIIFIDEIDAIGRARGKNASMGSNDERENTLNQLLTEMDGFGTNSGVIILAATNRADVLDSALMRAGRFDRQIYVDMPDVNERKEIFKVHLRPIKTDESIEVDFLAKQTPGFSGADIANLCNEAALIAARKQKNKVELQDFLDAVDRIVGGLEKKNKIITKEEKRTIAFHEAGHATISWLLQYAHPLVKVTIVPRGQSLGAAWYLPEERTITTTEQILDEMCSALGGRASELIMFGKISTGALSDLEKVTKQAYAMVSIYGLNEKLGNISFYDSQGRNEYSFSKPYSEDTAKTIDEESSKIIEVQYQRAIKILTENKDKLTQLAEILLKKEVIFKEDLVAIFGERPWGINEVEAEIKEAAKEIIENEETIAEVSSSSEEKSSEVKESDEITNEVKED